MTKKRKKGKPRRRKGKPLSETLAKSASGSADDMPPAPREESALGARALLGSDAIRRATAADEDEDDADEGDEPERDEPERDEPEEDEPEEDEPEEEAESEPRPALAAADEDRASSPEDDEAGAPDSAAESAPASARELDEEDDEEYDDDEDDDELGAAGQMGHRRYVMAGFFAAWLVGSYVLGRTLELLWSNLATKDWFSQNLPLLSAVPHEGELLSRATISLVVGGLLGAGIMIRYYVKPDVRTWADEVAEQLAQVKWPNRKEVGNNTIVVIFASTILTLYLTLLDRFWGFLTNLIYSSGI